MGEEREDLGEDLEEEGREEFREEEEEVQGQTANQGKPPLDASLILHVLVLALLQVL
jgi:hypothetical protein